MTTPRIAAAICTYNRYDLLGEAIESCLKQDLDPSEFEIIVVDNSPDHAAAESFGQAYREHANLTYLVERTPGLSNARNVAARNSSAPIIAYLDDDAIARPGWLRAYLAVYDSFGPAVNVAGGRINPIWDVPRPSWLSDRDLGYVSVVDWGGSARILKEHEWLAGANISFRRAALLEIGGFDTGLGRKGPELHLLSNEESEVIERLTENGGLALYVPQAEVDHLVDRRRLTQEWFRRRAAWQAVSDWVADPAMADRAEGALNKALDYLLRQPPRYRSISGLYREIDDPEAFREQVYAIYNFTIATLAGLKSVP
ncbi:glycosyltransferase family 2 protein [Jhaorihella thermophila]|uniref:Glycosyl transferase family 2 n=1 Tax=Jhaorihella thermophila TaxID=488547 RepID=A0A1H5Y7S1_9RHOB|nr:glycosyltransferase [Jhaorihella thermophila]SEG20024.1 Glycosyl transferase family 2 [Jhaorihella thermophila]